MFDDAISINSSALLIEDDYVSGLLMKKLCERKNVNLKIATNGKQALEILELENFEIIFMDVRMPDMSGYETTRIIRDIEKALHKRTPICCYYCLRVSGRSGEMHQCRDG